MENMFAQQKGCLLNKKKDDLLRLRLKNNRLRPIQSLVHSTIKGSKLPVGRERRDL